MIKPRWAAYLAIAVLIAVAMACLAALSPAFVLAIRQRARPPASSRVAVGGGSTHS